MYIVYVSNADLYDQIARHCKDDKVLNNVDLYSTHILWGPFFQILNFPLPKYSHEKQSFKDPL